jgi:hypothetical protein
MPNGFVSDLGVAVTADVKPWPLEWRTGEAAPAQPSASTPAPQVIGSKFEGSLGQSMPLSVFRSDRSLSPATAATEAWTANWYKSDTLKYAYYGRHPEELGGSDRPAMLDARALDSLGSFVLMKVAEGAGRVLVGTLEENLDGAHGWLAVARLINAGLLGENGRSVFVTERGESVARQLVQDLETA